MRLWLEGCLWQEWVLLGWGEASSQREWSSERRPWAWLWVCCCCQLGTEWMEEIWRLGLLQVQWGWESPWGWLSVEVRVEGGVQWAKGNGVDWSA